MKAFFAIVIGIVGLLISTCGLVFVAAAPPIALPCVIVGGLLIWGAVALFQSWRKAQAATAAPRSDDVTPPPA